MKTTSFLVQVVVLLVLGTLVAQAAVITGECMSSLGGAGLGCGEDVGGSLGLDKGQHAELEPSLPPAQKVLSVSREVGNCPLDSMCILPQD